MVFTLSTSPTRDRSDEASSHARCHDDPTANAPSWTFPTVDATGDASQVESADVQSMFSPRPVPQQQQQQHQSAPELDIAAPFEANSTQPSFFNQPNRSIFSSGPPTASVSANTAHASMSSPSPVRSAGPLSVLGGGSTPSKASRSVHYQSDEQATPRKSRIPRAEKDIDDPSISNDTSERRGTGTPTALNHLFAPPRLPDGGSNVSRPSSYIRTSSGTAYIRATGTETAPLPSHLYNQGLLTGKHSDITVHAFNTRYALHRLLLDRAPFFSSALSEPWFESTSKEITLHPDDIDSHITQAAFELALKRLYGCHVAAEEDNEAVGLFATGCWLEMPDLIDASVTSILRQMSTTKLGSLIRLVTSNYYGKPGDRILASAKAMLCREGWEMPLKYWDGVSGEIVREIIGGDGFFVPGEWERWVLAKRVFDRRLKSLAIENGVMEANGLCKRAPPNRMSFLAIRYDTVYRRHSTLNRPKPDAFDAWLSLYTSPDISAMLVLLDEGIHYVHLSFEQLQNIRDQRDVLGLPLMPEKVVNDALWMQMELRQKVLNTPDLKLELGLSHPSEDLHEDEVQEKGDVDNFSNEKDKGRDTGAGDDPDDDDDDDSNQTESGSWDGNGKPRKFWIPNVDSTSVMGGNPDTALYATPNTSRPYISRLSASIDPVDVQWASDFTASANERPTTSDRSEGVPPLSYTNYPPFRFAAEFPNPRTFKEKKRIYSRTVWYAGSLWNVYIQKVETTKNTQLGVYLHRAKEKEGVDDYRQSSSVEEQISQVEMLMHRNQRRNRRQSRGDLLDEDASNSSTDPDSTLVSQDQPSSASTISNLLRGSGSTRDTPPLTKSSQSPSTLTSLPYPINSDSENDDLLSQNRECTKTNRSVPTLPAYVDGRPTIKTYFKIYSPSKGGRMLSVYESAPDLFNFSQSWGWKSSTMVLDDGLCGYDSADIGNGRDSKGGKLRFMVVIGNV